MQDITINPHILNGTPVFTGTRVPIRILFEYLENDDNITKFLDDYPSVSKEQAINVINYAKDKLINNI